MTTLLGIDCSTDPRKTGLALGERRGDVVHILRCGTGAAGESTEDLANRISTDWLAGCEDVLIGLDAPLGWPKRLGPILREHRAGEPLGLESNLLFRRETDNAIKARLAKRPLEVGADRIARTAVAALALLARIRHAAGRPIPLAWGHLEEERWRAIEVYPAATRRAYGAVDKGGSLVGLDRFLDWTAVPDLESHTTDVIDAAVCALAIGDFMRGLAMPPADLETAKIEGWIWAS